MIRRKNSFWSMLFILAILLQGCASNPDKMLAKKDLDSVQQIKLCRYQFEGYMKETTGAQVTSAIVAAPFMVFGALGGAIGGGLYGSVKTKMMLSAGREMQTMYKLPDFTELLHKDLSEKLSTRLPGSTKLVFEGKPVDDESERTSDGLITIKAIAIVDDGIGLRTVATVEMTDSTNNILWKKRYWYNSSDFNRPSDFVSLEADGGKKLHEEIANAAQLTVADFVNHFNTRTDSQNTEAAEEQK